MPEARLEDGVPQTAGWFVVNMRDAPWMHNDMRVVSRFGGEGEAHFDEVGIALYWVAPGQPMTVYHQEPNQEDFLVLRGTATLVVEGQERALGTWDLFHCPPDTPHTIVATGDEPALVLGVGARGRRGIRYPFDETAAAHGASAERTTDSPAEAYARFSAPERGPAPPIFDAPAA